MQCPKESVFGFHTAPTFWVSSGAFEGTFVSLFLVDDIMSSSGNVLYAAVQGAC